MMYFTPPLNFKGRSRRKGLKDMKGRSLRKDLKNLRGGVVVKMKKLWIGMMVRG